jgi:hypothetical protein
MSDNYDEKDFVLLTENTYADGALGTIFGPVATNLKKYGEILKSSAKLIGGDIAALLALTFGRLKDLKEQEDFMKKHKGNREKHLQSISSNSKALMESWPDGKITSMMIAPGLFFTSSALSGAGTVTSKEFRSEIGELGLNRIPILGQLFKKQNDFEGPEFWQELKRDMSTGGDWAAAGDKIDGKMKAWLSGDSSRDTGSMTMFQRINKIFLWSHYEPAGGVLLEADELEEIDEEELKLLKKKFEEFIKNQLEEEWPIDRKQLLSQRKASFDEIVDDAEKVISLNSTLAATQNSEEFFKTLKNMSDLMGDTSQIDVAKIEASFKEMGTKLKDDEASMEELKKEFEEEKIEPTDETVTQKITSICLDQFKGQFLPKSKEGLVDYYDEVYDLISQGLEKSQMKEISKDPYGSELVNQIKEHKKKLDTALTKLKGN